MKTLFRFGLSVLALSAGLGVTNAKAQTPELSFYPANAWTASKGELCTLANEFNNGFIIQMNGDERGTVSMTLDVRQAVFDAGTKYPVVLSVPGHYKKTAQAIATNGQNVQINLKGRQDFYNAARGEAVFDMTIEDNRFRFHLSKMEQAAISFEQCMDVPSVAHSAQETENIIVSTTPERAAESVQPPIPITPTLGTYTHRGNDKSGLEYLGIKDDSSIQVQRETYTLEADVTSGDDTISKLERENRMLRDELQVALRESRQEEVSIKGENWNLEKATLMYGEAERQAQLLGQKLQRQETKCQGDIRELEAMLFDPQVTNEQQMSKLADLEAQLLNTQDELQSQRMRYDERIRFLEGQLQAQ